MDFHVFTTHTRGGDDSTPIQFVSMEQLDYYRRAETLAAAVGALLVGEVLTAIILAVCTSRVLVIG